METKTTSISNFMERGEVYESPNFHVITIYVEQGFAASTADTEGMVENNQNPW